MFGYELLHQPLHRLSYKVYEAEDAEFDIEEWVASAHPLDDHALEHPDVTALVAFHKQGVDGVLAYLGEHFDDDDAGAVVRWAGAGAFKGRFEDAAEFAESEFCDAIEGRIANWGEAVGFPDAEPFGHFVNWGEVGEYLEEASPQRFQFVAGGECVYVFDLLTELADYRKKE